jgi:hypothetical protein
MPFDWKRPAAIGASFALTAVAAIVAVVGIFHWYSSRPQSWDARTIKGISTTVSQTFDLDEQRKDFTASGFMLVFVLENTSGRDYTVPENLRLFERSSKTGALEELKAKLDHSFVVPAKEKTEVHASVEYGCSNEDLATGKTTERDGETCFKDAFGNVTDFVGFDDNTHTRLNLPKPVYAGGTSQPAKADNGMAPDRGKPWERYAACAQATKLVPVCKQQRIALEDGKAAADGWTPVGPLPAIPPLPNGFNLDPGEANCRMAYQWDYYCRKQGMSK